MPQDDNFELRSEEVQEILTRIPHWMIRWGNVVIFIVLMLIFAMSWVIKYPDIIVAEITITTQAPPEKLIAKSSGRIEKILIKNRQHVTKGTPLAVIENTADYKNVFALKSIIDTLKITSSGFTFPFEKLSLVKLGDIDAQYAAFQKNYIAYSLNSKLQPYSVDGTAQKLEIVQLKERLSLLMQQKDINDIELSLKKKELERFRKLNDKGVIATQEWDSKNIEYLQAEKNVRSLNSSISQMRSSINELNKTSKTTKINETKDDVNLYNNVLQSYSQLKKSISDWEMAYVLRSSISGEISFLQVWNENQTITAGDYVFTIIPSNENNYIGKVRAKAQNSGKLKENQDVNIRLANYPDAEFGVVRGKVKAISLSPDKEGNLLIDVALPNNLETSYHKKIIFQQEMTGTAEIITEDLRLIERLLYQFRGLFRRD